MRGRGLVTETRAHVIYVATGNYDGRGLSRRSLRNDVIFFG